MAAEAAQMLAAEFGEEWRKKLAENIRVSRRKWGYGEQWVQGRERQCRERGRDMLWGGDVE